MARLTENQVQLDQGVQTTLMGAHLTLAVSLAALGLPLGYPLADRCSTLLTTSSSSAPGGKNSLHPHSQRWHMSHPHLWTTHYVRDDLSSMPMVGGSSHESPGALAVRRESGCSGTKVTDAHNPVCMGWEGNVVNVDNSMLRGTGLACAWWGGPGHSGRQATHTYTYTHITDNWGSPCVFPGPPKLDFWWALSTQLLLFLLVFLFTSIFIMCFETELNQSQWYIWGWRKTWGDQGWYLLSRCPLVVKREKVWSSLSLWDEAQHPLRLLQTQIHLFHDEAWNSLCYKKRIFRWTYPSWQ